jgi:hypothetical protein
MKRVQLFEFEDQKWFPDKMRISLTKLIIVLHKMMGLGELLAERVKYALEKSGESQIVDLGSGAGGAMPDVFLILKEDDTQDKTKMLLTDLYPNKATVHSINSKKNPNISYHEGSVDATNLKNVPEGLKTMVNSFHHMNEPAAKQILSSAASNKESILIYEMSENKMPLLLWWLMLPISFVIMIVMVLFMTPFVKPLTFYQIFFTYFIPVIPISYAWDGQASMPRIYTLNDLDILLEGIDSKGYHWEKGPAINKKGKAQGYFLLGTPE